MYTRLPPQLQSKRAGPNTRCQKCLKLGHFSFECTSTPTYVARPSRTKQLADAGDLAFPGNNRAAPKLFGRGKDRDQPSVTVPDEFKKGPSGVGLADEILRAKEEARKRLGMGEKKRGKAVNGLSKGKKRSPSPSSSSSSSVSDSDSDSSTSSTDTHSRSPPARRQRKYSSSPSRSPPPDRRPARSPTPERRRRRYTSEVSAGDRRSRSPVRRAAGSRSPIRRRRSTPSRSRSP